MSLRFDYKAVEPDAYKALLSLYKYVHNGKVDSHLLHLIDVRASQINGCAFCLDMHTKQAKSAGETDERLHTLAAWRDTPYFTPRERAVLALTEFVTRIGDSGVPDDVYAEVAEHFSEQEITQLLVAIIAINGWNRLAISTHMMPPFQN